MDAKLEEESRLRRIAERELAELRATSTNNQSIPANLNTAAHATSIPIAQPAYQTAKTPKVATPDKFDGTRGSKAEIFSNQVGLYIMMNPTQFPDDRTKIGWTLSYMTGKGGEWAKPITQRLLNRDSETFTWDDFSKSFEATFYDSERVAKAEKAIRALKQTGTVLAYSLKFNDLALIVKWPPSVLITQFEQGSKSEVQVQMVRDEFKTLDEISELAIKIDNKLHKRNDDSFVEVKEKAVDPDAMDCSAYRFNISNEEYQRRWDGELCFKCGKSGHRARECGGGFRGRWRGKFRGGRGAKVSTTEADVEDSGKERGRAEESKNGVARG
jgi:hypothetical protein